MLDERQMLVMLAEERREQAIVVENQGGEVAIFRTVGRIWTPATSRALAREFKEMAAPSVPCSGRENHWL